MLVSNIPSHDLLLVTLGRGVAFASPTHIALALETYINAINPTVETSKTPPDTAMTIGSLSHIQ